MQILSEEQEALLKREREALNQLQLSLVSFGIETEDRDSLARSIQQIDDLFLLVVVGEFNSGKSSFINALLGQKILKEGVTPTTTQINLLRYGETEQHTILEEDLMQINAPNQMLREISIVDTPGTNAVIRKHEIITTQFVPRADLVLFVTSADRPFTESERSFIEKIRDWGKKLVVVLNKIDILQTDEEIEQVRNFILNNFRSLLDIEPEIFPVSSRAALAAKLGRPEIWSASRFEPLENHIISQLDEKSRLQLKLLNPIGVGLFLIDRYLQIIENRLNLLSEDVKMINQVDHQLIIYKEDMLHDFQFRMGDIEKILYAMENRGKEFFDETLRIGRVFDLFNKKRIQSQFEEQVISDVPQQIDRKVTEMIDWMVDRDFRQWEAITSHLTDRRKKHQDNIIGDNGTDHFNYDREHLIDAVGREASRIVDNYDRQKEASLIAEGAQSAVAAAAALEVGAIGLGALITAIATTMAADVTGILVASLVAVLGLFVIPARRRQANRQLNEKVSELRTQLVKSLHDGFEHEMERSLDRIQTAISPYTRFVRSERSELLKKQDELQTLQTRLLDLKERIQQIQ